MLFNDIVGLLMDVPPMLAAQWGAWFAVGLALSIWTRREKSRLVVVTAGSRQRSSGSRPVARPPKTVVVPQVSGDAFGELEALFNEVQEGSHRPGDAAPASEPPVPVAEPLRNAPVLTAPQSLP
jgi:hypothetical protein